MRLTHLADYAVVMMTAAARREPSTRLTATELSEDTGVPLPTAQKLMQKLAAHGLLVGQRGSGGGYALALPVTEISLADIVEAVEGPIVLTMCADGVNHECALDAHCKVKPHMSIVGDAIRSSLESVSLAQLCCSPAEAGAQERDSAADAAPWTPAFAGEQEARP
jgi:FeS assembly SUF system regulator